MITKYASLESAQVLDIRSSDTRQRTASLDKFSDFHEYRTEDGYLYARIRAISSRVNKNNDGWPSIELAGSSEIFDRHVASEGGFTVEASEDADYGFSTFLGKPIFVDHHNSDPERARGVIVDAKLHVEDFKTAASLDPYYASAPDNHTPPTWVELLLEVDANSFPRLAKAIIEGKDDSKAGIDGFSMGCDVEKSVCNICKNAAFSPDDYCQHVKLKGAHFDFIENDGKKTSKKSYEDCYGIKFFEISAVFDPADETALIRDVVHKEAANKESDVFPDHELERLRQQAPLGTVSACEECGSTLDGPQCGVCGALTPEGRPNRVPGPEEQNYEALRLNNQIDQEFGTTEHPLGPTASVHEADNPLPQSDLTHAPQELDTLRNETVCDICGSTMDDTTCEICGYVKPPAEFENPDLTQARPEEDPGFEPTPEPHPGVHAPSTLAEPQGSIPAPIAGVRTDMAKWETKLNPRVAGRINVTEQPITTSTSPATDEPPQETIVKDETQPVTSRTAKEFIAAAERGKENNMSEKQKVAAEPVPAASPDKRIDVDGTGGIVDASNEEASKADGQVDVEGTGGTGVEDVSADQEGVNVDQGDEHSKNIEGTKTDTWSGDKRQHSPVGGDTFPSENGQGAGKWSTNIEAAKKGTDPVDPVGKADDRVDVEAEVSVDWNQSGKALDQWTGTDGNGVTRQQSPVTQETLEGDDIVNLKSSKHIFAAIKLADLEVELGLLDAEQKYDRMAELEGKPEEVVEAELAYASKVKTAGLKRSNRVGHTASRLPSFRGSTAPSEKEQEVTDESLFL